MRQAFLFLAAVTLAASGCSTRDDSGKTIVTYTRWGNPAEMESTKELIAQFEVEHPDVEVRVDVVSWGQYWQKMKTSVVSGTAQDVWLLAPTYAEQYASAGHLLALDNFVRGGRGVDLDDFFRDALDDFTFSGRGDAVRPAKFGTPGASLYALPRDYNCRVLYYNRDHFDAEALDYPDGTWTWDDLVVAARKLTRDFDGDGVTDQWGYVGLEYTAMIHAIGGSTLDAEAARSTYRSDEVVRTIAFCHALIYRHKVHPPPEVQIGSSGAFMTGKASMMVSGIWNVREYNHARYRWDIAPIPLDAPGTVRHMSDGGVAHCISRSTKHPEAAWELVKFLSSATSQRALARSGTSVPVLKSVAYSDDFLAPFKCPQRSSLHYIFEDLTSPRSPRRSPRGHMEYTRQTTTLLDGVWRNHRPVEDACREIDEVTNRVLRRYYDDAGRTREEETPQMP